MQIDLQNKCHRNHAVIGKAINFFCLWMQEYWGYLLHSDQLSWKTYLRESRDMHWDGAERGLSGPEKGEDLVGGVELVL